MTKAQADAVVKFIQSGGKVLLRSGPYVDGFAWLEEANGVMHIRSEVYAARPVEDLRFIDLRFFNEIDPEAMMKGTT